MTRFTLLTATAAALLAAPALAQTADFAAYDSNSDGQVSFTEYAKWAQKDGLSTTAAAQRFIKMTNGQASLDEGAFLVAMSSDPSYYDQPIVTAATVSAPNTVVLSDTITDTQTVVSEPVIADPVVTISDPMTETWETPAVEPTITPDTDIDIDLGVEPELETDMNSEMDMDADVTTEF